MRRGRDTDGDPSPRPGDKRCEPLGDSQRQCTTRSQDPQAGEEGQRPALLLLVSAAIGLILPVGVARAELTYLGSFGSSGTAAGQFARPAGIAVNDLTGDVYVADRNQNRIEEFSAAGSFIRMWGYGVVQSGPDNVPHHERQSVTIRGADGTFRLTFGADTSAPIPYNASAEEVEAGLNAVPSIGVEGGSVTVTGGPGDVSGSHPYLVTFSGGPLGDTDVPALTVDAAGIAQPQGMTLTCVGGPAATTQSIQWLRNGEQIPGATATTYVTKAADAGRPVQCQFTAINTNTGATQVSSPALVASPAPGKDFPVPPPTIPAPGQSATLNAPGPTVDTTLTCSTGVWSGAPTFSYQWYRDGVPIVGATEQEYVVAESSLSASASFQCAVIGTNGDGTVTKVSESSLTSPAPSPSAPAATAAATFPAALQPTVTTIDVAGEAFEICEVADVCQPGRSGGAIGKFSSPRGIAVDNSPGGSGDVYVVDDQNLRVQKFSSTGIPILTFGRGVNQTTGGDLCTVESGDVCGPGSVNTGMNPGQFGAWPAEGSFAELPNQIAVDDSGNVFVADVRAGASEEGRIEKFGPSGLFLGQVRILGGSTNPSFYARPMSVGVNSEDRVFTSTSAGIEIFDQSQLGLADVGPSFANQKLIYEGERPSQVSVDTHDKIWLTETNLFGREICGVPGPQRRAILALDGKGRLLDCTEPLGAAELPDVTGLAVAPSGIAYAAVGSQNTIKTFELPEAHQPEITSQTAAAVTTRSARLQARIDPGFEATSFTFEYGLGDCEANSCASVAGSDDVNGTNDALAEVPIADLQPNTKYHFRVRAQNRLGEAIGVDRTFVTFPEVDLLNDPCPNALARQQTRAAGLDDCRAYELASAEFAGGYDVESDLVPGQTPFDGYPDADGKLLYAVHNGGIPGTGKPTNRGPDPYVATRNAATKRWETKYVGIPADAPSALPFSSTVAGGDAGLDTIAFGGSEICAPCFADGTAGMPIHLPDGTLVQGMRGSIGVPAPQPAGQVDKPLSGDGSHFVFGSEQQFEPAGNAGSVTIYDRDLTSGTTQVASTMPDGSTMTGDVVEVDISDDGSRILIGRLVSTDPEGNQYFDLYMHVGGNAASVPVAETPSGVLFAGMTGDGSKVLFTTRDPLADDTDTSTDLFSADVSPPTATISRISTGTGGTGDTDACDPAPNSFNPEDWNTTPGGPDRLLRGGNRRWRRGREDNRSRLLPLPRDARRQRDRGGTQSVPRPSGLGSGVRGRARVGGQQHGAPVRSLLPTLLRLLRSGEQHRNRPRDGLRLRLGCTELRLRAWSVRCQIRRLRETRRKLRGRGSDRRLLDPRRPVPVGRGRRGRRTSGRCTDQHCGRCRSEQSVLQGPICSRPLQPRQVRAIGRIHLLAAAGR